MSLTAWIQLLLIGFAIGACLLLIFWWKSKAFSFHRLVLLTVFFTFDLILFGAFTRLTDSGLGCPDWPGCYGLSNPIAALPYRDWETDRKSTRLNSSHSRASRMPSSA